MRPSSSKPTPIALSITNQQVPLPSELEVGWKVIIQLASDVGNLRVFVGEIQLAGVLGLRITLVDWMIGAFCGADMWFPWSQILGLQVYTNDHEWRGVDLGAIQTRWLNDKKSEEDK